MCSVSISSLLYRDTRHAHLPHIVSFSGGRSSAMLALLLAERGLLRKERGDLLIFANTSAEHPGTYDFAAECKHRIERDYGLPMLWFEFCTVEDAMRGEYRRRESYRLVKPLPAEQDPDGYCSDGRTFEEMLAFQGMLPNPHSRTCTAKLKLYPAHKLIADWIGGMSGPAHAGHHWTANDTNMPETLLTASMFADAYLTKGGTASYEHAERRGAYLADRPPRRESQRFADFTSVDLSYRDEERNGQTPRPAPMRGREAAQHVRLLGLRADEANRVNRVLDRCLLAEGATTSACTVATQPPGERPYFPLFDANIDAGMVKDFWDSQDFDLDIPEDAGNCTFCFMKGTRKIVALSNRTDSRRQAGRPTDIEWWAALEQRHMRIVPSSKGTGMSSFGFFGVNGDTFQRLCSGETTGSSRYAQGVPACDCTD